MRISELRDLLNKDKAVWGNHSSFKLAIFHVEYRLIRKKRFCDYFKSINWLKPIYYLERWEYHRLCRKCGCDIPSGVCMGGGIKLVHAWGIVINSQSSIGENVTILSGSVIGATKTGVPTIGNNVTIGAHALILGGITIGNNADIGAGAIVTHDVPNGGVVYSEASKVRRIK
jgi:serine O-acetyltransferase